VWPDDQPVFMRISATDWLGDRPSWDVDQSARLAPLLAEAGADLIDVSAGGIAPDQEIPHAGPGYQLPYAEAIREHLRDEGVDLAVGTVGGITAPEQADQIVGTDSADAVLIGRGFLRDPYWPLHAAAELGDEDAVEWPIQYRRAV
jgi:2,4-dienoyl-CoA reductase-like NADH-dependent reductase (Old Yellow Enzyme family)